MQFEICGCDKLLRTSVDGIATKILVQEWSRVVELGITGTKVVGIILGMTATIFVNAHTNLLSLGHSVPIMNFRFFLQIEAKKTKI